jgi:hypothetical protein
MKFLFLMVPLLLIISPPGCESFLGPADSTDEVEKSSLEDSQQACVREAQSREEVLPGLILSWDSSFRCENAPDAGSFEFTIIFSNDERSAQAAQIDTLMLTHTTPRPRFQAPKVTVEELENLPLLIQPGSKDSLIVRGKYELVSTDEGNKANLHFQAKGIGFTTKEPFRLGINAHLRAPDASE